MHSISGQSISPSSMRLKLFQVKKKKLFLVPITVVNPKINILSLNKPMSFQTSKTLFFLWNTK